MQAIYNGNPDTVVIPSELPVPGFGLLPVNAFVIKAQQPVLVDTGMAKDDNDFLAALATVIDPKDIRWIFLTHEDRDHAGNLRAMLAAAPQARLVTSFVSVGKIAEEWMVPIERVLMVNWGQSLDVGDRQLATLRPPLFDSGASTGLYDAKTGTCFSVDTFGAFLSELTPNLDDVPPSAFLEGSNIFQRANSPWVHLVDRSRFAAAVDTIRRLKPDTILSSHLPPAIGRTEALCEALLAIPSLPEFAPPDQQAFERILSQAKGNP